MQQNGHSNSGSSVEIERKSLSSVHEGEDMIESTNDTTLLLGSQNSGYGAMAEVSTPNKSLNLVTSVSLSTTESSKKKYLWGFTSAVAVSLLLIIFQATCFDEQLLKELVTYFYVARLVYYILFFSATVLPFGFILRKDQSEVSSFFSKTTSLQTKRKFYNK